MDKYDYIVAILDDLRGTTGLNFQFKIQKVLSKYYKSYGKTYEMPSPYGGDDKNDGWVIEDAIFYQIYAPTQVKSSLAKNIQDKFEEDLIGLVEKLKEGKWNGKINKFVFIVNTFDTPLPKDPNRFFYHLVEDVKEKNKIEFDYKIDNLDYIDDILTEILDIDILEDIASILKVKNTIPINSITEKILLDTIEAIGSNMNEKLINTLNFGTYKKISTIKKISINNLDEKREEIETFMKHLDVVESTVEIVNQDIRFSNTFERVINLVVSKYELLSRDYKGIELLDRLYLEIQRYSSNEVSTGIPTKLLIVYIFDKCDIFEKEEGEGDDTTK